MNIFSDPRYPTTWTNDEILAAERREQALNDAYAAGRADEREEWAPVLEALRPFAAFVFGQTWVGHQMMERDGGDTIVVCGYDVEGQLTGVNVLYSDFLRAQAAIAKITGEQA